MAAANEYRRKAEECLAQAALVDDPQIKAELLALATNWKRLADQASAERKLPGPLPPPEPRPDDHAEDC